MPIDAICLQAVVHELEPQLVGMRVDKIQQPAKDQIVLLLRGKRVLLNAGAGAPRIQLTEIVRDNPAEPPMFCMLLRKHLAGARITAVSQPPLERLVRLELDASDELGRMGRRSLVLEAMGRRSNLILLDEEGRVIDCLRRVDAEMSARRQVLPGLYYEPPASVGRLPVTEETEAGFRERFAGAPAEKTVDAFLLDQYFGLSPLLARELAFRAAGDVDCRLFELAGPEGLWRELEAFIGRIRENRFTPVCLLREGKPLDFACVPVGQYGGGVETVEYETFSGMLDAFYAARERAERTKQRGADLLRAANNARDRLRRKLALQEKEYAQLLVGEYGAVVSVVGGASIMEDLTEAVTGMGLDKAGDGLLCPPENDALLPPAPARPEASGPFHPLWMAGALAAGGGALLLAWRARNALAQTVGGTATPLPRSRRQAAEAVRACGETPRPQVYQRILDQLEKE